MLDPLTEEPVERNKLLHDSIKYPDHLEINCSSYFDAEVKGASLPEGKECHRIPIHDELNDFKYAILIDGHAGSWGRPSLILSSDAVPIVI